MYHTYPYMHGSYNSQAGPYMYDSLAARLVVPVVIRRSYTGHCKYRNSHFSCLVNFCVKKLCVKIFGADGIKRNFFTSRVY